MKAFHLFLLAIALTACTHKKKEHITIVGTVKNSSEKTLIVQNNSYQKEIEIQEDGSFKDTLHLKALEDTSSYNASFYAIRIGEQQTLAYLLNGFELTVNVDGDDFEFSGKGAQNTNYITEKIALNNEQMRSVDLMALKPESFEKSLAEIKDKNQMLLDKHAGSRRPFCKRGSRKQRKALRLLRNTIRRVQKHSKRSPLPLFFQLQKPCGRRQLFGGFQRHICLFGYLGNLVRTLHTTNPLFERIGNEIPRQKHHFCKHLHRPNQCRK